MSNIPPLSLEDFKQEYLNRIAYYFLGNRIEKVEYYELIQGNYSASNTEFQEFHFVDVNAFFTTEKFEQKIGLELNCLFSDVGQFKSPDFRPAKAYAFKKEEVLDLGHHPNYKDILHKSISAITVYWQTAKGEKTELDKEHGYYTTTKSVHYPCIWELTFKNNQQLWIGSKPFLVKPDQPFPIGYSTNRMAIFFTKDSIEQEWQLDQLESQSITQGLSLSFDPINFDQMVERACLSTILGNRYISDEKEVLSS